MANTKISALTAASALGGTEAIPAVQSAATTKVTPAQIGTYVCANATPVTLTGGTVTTSTPVIDASQTWNAGAVTFIADDINITNTASASTSRLFRRRVGGSEVTAITRAGGVVATGAGPTSPAFCFAGLETTGLYAWSNAPAFTVGGTITYSFTSTSLNTTAQIAFGSATGVGDVALVRVAAGILKVSNGSSGAGVIVTPHRLVSTLPHGVAAGARSFVTDATSTTFLSIVAGGGTNRVPVVSDGLDWLIG